MCLSLSILTKIQSIFIFLHLPLLIYINKKHKLILFIIFNMVVFLYYSYISIPNKFLINQINAFIFVLIIFIIQIYIIKPTIKNLGKK